MLFYILDQRLPIGLEQVCSVRGQGVSVEITVGAASFAVRYMQVKRERLAVVIHKTAFLKLALALPLFLLSGCQADHSSPPLSEVTPPPGMAYVPGGEFLTGSTDLAGDPSVGPLRKVSIPAFYIDKTEMSNAQVKAVYPEHTFAPGTENAPAVGLSYNLTIEVLAKVDKRLPSSLEWEKAARGLDGRIYPWGNEPNFDERAHVGSPRDEKTQSCTWGQLVDVNSYEDGASPFGLINTVGNAWEWVADEPTKTRPYHSIKGGAYGYPAYQNRLDNVGFEQPGAT